MLSYADSRALLSLGNVWVRYETKSLEICPSLILELSDLSKKPGVQKQFREKIIQPLFPKAPCRWFSPVSSGPQFTQSQASYPPAVHQKSI